MHVFMIYIPGTHSYVWQHRQPASHIPKKIGFLSLIYVNDNTVIMSLCGSVYLVTVHALLLVYELTASTCSDLSQK